jgi:hypothetical protein
VSAQTVLDLRPAPAYGTSRLTGLPWCPPGQGRSARSASCGQVKPIASGTLEKPRCRDCTVPTFADCPVCATSPQPGQCPGYCLELRLRELVNSPDGGIHPSLATLKDALAADPSGTTLRWLARQPIATVLADNTTGRRQLTHSELDGLEQTAILAHLRSVLVATGTLPPHDEQMARLERFVSDVLATCSDLDQRQILRRHAVWHLLRRLRAQQRAGSHDPAVRRRASARPCRRRSCSCGSWHQVPGAASQAEKGLRARLPPVHLTAAKAVSGAFRLGTAMQMRGPERRCVRESVAYGAYRVVEGEGGTVGVDDPGAGARARIEGGADVGGDGVADVPQCTDDVPGAGQLERGGEVMASSSSSAALKAVGQADRYELELVMVHGCQAGDSERGAGAVMQEEPTPEWVARVAFTVAGEVGDRAAGQMAEHARPGRDASVVRGASAWFGEDGGGRQDGAHHGDLGGDV